MNVTTPNPSHRTSESAPRGGWPAFVLVRAGWGLVLLGVPPGLLRSLGVPSGGMGIRVVRLLGLRHLLQAAAQASGRGRGRVGALVDLLHGMSMLLLAIVDARRRRAALADAVVAGVLLAWGRALSCGPPDHSDTLT